MNSFEGILWAGGRMSADEESWASWKCGGGPHVSREAFSSVISKPAGNEALVAKCAIVAYSGTESILDMPVTPKMPNQFMADLPA